MNPYLKAVMPTLLKTLLAMIFGAIWAFGLPLVNVVSNVGQFASGESIEPLTGLLKTSLPIFLAVSSSIYIAWSLAALLIAFVKSKTTTVKPARVEDEKIEDASESTQPEPTEKMDPYFKKYVTEEDLKKEEEKSE